VTSTLDQTEPAPARVARPVGTVLVTGAASGLGRAVAQAVLAAGGRPLLLDRVDCRDVIGPDLADAPTVVADLADARRAEQAVAELAGEVGLSLLIPGGMDTAFFDGRTEQYRPGPDAQLNDPANVADAVLFALSRPEGCEVREMVVAASTEPSWP
jgi:NADP-dependent 3-hydroxy acid dehydrogenase YdfG